MTHAAVHAVPSRATPAGTTPGRIRQGRLELATTPGRLRLVLGGLVLLSLAWGALAAFTAVQYASAASSVVTVQEPLSLAAQQIYARLSDANDAAITAFLTGGIEPAGTRQRYQGDIGAAGSEIQHVTASGGAGAPGAARDLTVLAQELPVYTGEIETARADSRLGLPLGAAYLREASGLMRDTLLPRAQDLYAAQNASLSGTSAAATGLPLLCVTAVAGLLVGFLLYRSSRWLTGRTNRVFNAGLAVAGLLTVIMLAWLLAAYAAGRGDLLGAQARGSATVAAAARVSIAAEEAHADESLTLVDNTGDDAYQSDYQSRMRALGPGPGTLLTAAQATARGTPAAAAVTAAVGDAQAWFAAHRRVRALDDSGQHALAVHSVRGTGTRDAGAAFSRLSADLDTATTKDQAVFDATAHSAAGAFSGLEAGLIAASLLMAAACALGLGRRLAEYR